MRLLVQRVASAHVVVEGEEVGRIGEGLLVFVAFNRQDNAERNRRWVRKVVDLRVFDDEHGVPNRSLRDTGGAILLVSQFTLYAQTKKGNRPSFIDSAPSEVALPLYETFHRYLEAELGREVATGRFGANMEVALVNSGPYTLWLGDD